MKCRTQLRFNSRTSKFALPIEDIAGLVELTLDELSKSEADRCAFKKALQKVGFYHDSEGKLGYNLHNVLHERDYACQTFARQ
eukprot:scaffold678450_cov81-Prasinocladus_malaysianus.AAC.1